MQIETPEIKKIVLDYDILLDMGINLPVTIDSERGDTIEVTPTQIVVKIHAKPSIADPLVILPAEELTVFVSHIVSINKRAREIIELTPEQKFEQTKLFKEWGTIQ